MKLNDLVLWFQVRVQVEDAGIPPLSAEAFVDISVLRNFHTPVLPPESETIPYNTYRGRVITTLRGTDADLTVSQ